MGNFDFVQVALPSVHADCARAESYLTSDPRAACIYGRRAIEVLVLTIQVVTASKHQLADAALAAHPPSRYIAGDNGGTMLAPWTFGPSGTRRA